MSTLAPLLLALSAAPAGGEEPRDAAALRVLYAGVPGHARAVEFVGFLSGRFGAVGELALEDLSPEAAADWDVVLVDLPHDLPYTRYADFAIPAGFDRPTVLMGVGGARLGEAYRLKIDDG